MSTPPSPHFYDGNDYPLEESIAYLMRQVVMMLSAIIDERMAEHDLTDAQWKPLLMILQRRCSTAAELARQNFVDTGAVTRLLDRVEAKGLVRRHRSMEDRRVVKLELTDAGRAVAHKVPHVLADVLNGALAGFSADEVGQLTGMLKRLLANARLLRDCPAAGSGTSA